MSIRLQTLEVSMRVKRALVVLSTVGFMALTLSQAFAQQGPNRCTKQCGGGKMGGCQVHTVPAQQCYNRCMGYEACPGVGFGKKK